MSEKERCQLVANLNFFLAQQWLESWVDDVRLTQASGGYLTKLGEVYGVSRGDMDDDQLRVELHSKIIPNPYRGATND